MKDAFQTIGFLLRFPFFIFGVALYSSICLPFCVLIVGFMSLRYPFAMLGHLLSGDRKGFERESKMFSDEAGDFLTWGYRGLYKWLTHGGRWPLS